jgi:hypothetical protein
MEEFDALFATALRGLERREPGWLHLRLTADPQVEASARELIERESECCSFFDFRLTHADGDLRLDVRVPEGRVDVVDGIARQAEAARAAGAAGFGVVSGAFRSGQGGRVNVQTLRLPDPLCRGQTGTRLNQADHDSTSGGQGPSAGRARTSANFHPTRCDGWARNG